MVLFGRKHLHVSESDRIIDSLFKIMSSVSSGSIKLEVANQPAMKIEINTNDDQDTALGLTIKVKVAVMVCSFYLPSLLLIGNVS
jgi:hypothetical protein